MLVFSWLFVLEAVAITAANAATIVIFTRTRRLHRKQYIMIINQAVVDLFIGVVSVPLFIKVKEGGYSDHVFRSAFHYQDVFFGAASLFGLAALAIERAHATYFPFRHSALGKGPYIIGIVVMWTATIVNLGLFILERRRVYTIGFTLVIIVVAYFLIVLKVRCTTTQAHDVNIQENKKLTVTLAVVTILSLVMWLPYPFLIIFSTSFPLATSSSHALFFVKFLHYGNSLVNSVVYALRMREIKRQILGVFQCCRSNQISINNESELRNT